MATHKTVEAFTFGELNPTKNPETEPVVDFERLSPLGILTKTVEKANRQDILEGAGLYKAIVLRDESNYDGTGFIDRMFSSDAIRFKARIPELHAALPIPSDVERSKERDPREWSTQRLINNKIIDMYPTFEAKKEDGLLVPPVGSIVYVDFGNRSTMGDPIYIGLLDKADTGIIGANPDETRPGESKGAFDSIKGFLGLGSNNHLPNHDLNKNEPPMLKIVSVPADKIKFGSKKGQSGHPLKVREDIEGPVRNIAKHCKELGTTFVSRESLRPFSNKPSPGGGSIATSLHYTGLAIDLWRLAGCHPQGNPRTQQYVVQYDPSDTSSRPKFIVWARSDKPGAVSEGPFGTYFTKEQRIPALDMRGRVGRARPRIIPVEGNFVNLTQIMSDYGFFRIRGRRDFYSHSSEKLAEWWHFEYRPEDLSGSSYGDTLSKIYKPPREGKDGLPWKSKRKVWTGSSFG